MNRRDLQQLAEDRILDAQALLNAGRWSAAYYLAGYAVECALKACVAKQTREHDFPDKDTANRVFTHNLVALTKLALPESVLEEMEQSKDSPLYKNWLIAKDWNEKARLHFQ